MIRNPYCIEKTINTFSYAADHYPTNGELKDYFDQISSYSVPIEVLSKFSVTEEKYKKWLKILFIMLTPTFGERCILDDFAEGFFDFSKFFHLIYLCSYANEICLLSDRSYVDISSIFENSNGVTFGFNLRKDAFIYLSFFPNDVDVIIRTLLKNNPNINGLVHNAKFLGIKQFQYNLTITRIKDNIDMLKSYNKHVIYQSFDSVYGASSKINK
ncbi:hypothetical protein [Acinetobacter sp. YK3]|uniref:hypothetical protein n=1 Tax=Acinetobacter sp. YK3 TaxID=1860097 RepID=UPI001112DA12|nr:hypothetical protein [Acinetobacter sp. YK3]